LLLVAVALVQSLVLEVELAGLAVAVMVELVDKVESLILAVAVAEADLVNLAALAVQE
jgi:hypothetical protein